MKEKTLIAAAVNPGDCFYLPPGWAMLEAAASNTTGIGVRLQVVRKCDMKALEEMHELTKKMGKPNDSIRTIVDKFVLMGQ